MSNNINDNESNSTGAQLPLNRRLLLTAGAFGLAGAGMGTVQGATEEDDTEEDDGDGRPFAEKDHDHSSDHLGLDEPLQRIDVHNVNNDVYPQNADEIKIAIENASPGQRIVLPTDQTSYTIDNPINVRERVRVTGSMRTSAVRDVGGLLVKTNDAPLFDIRNTTASFERVIVRGLGDDGSTDGWYTDEDQRVGRLFLTECVAEECGRDGFHFGSANVSQFSACQGHSNERHGVFIGGSNANASTFTAFDAYGNGGDGMHVNGAYNTTIIGGYAAANDGIGYYINSRYIHAHGIGGEGNLQGSLVIDEGANYGNVFIGHNIRGISNKSEYVNVWNDNPDVSLRDGGVTGSYMRLDDRSRPGTWDAYQSTTTGSYVLERDDSTEAGARVSLQGDGDLDFENTVPGQGVLVTTPDGMSRYRIRVDNEGELVTEEVEIIDEDATTPAWHHSLTIDGDVGELENIGSLNVDDDFSVFRGDRDITGDVWLTWDESSLYFAAEVTDSDHAQNNDPNRLYRGDSFQWAVSAGEPGEADEWSEFTFGLTPDGPAVYRARIPGEDEVLDAPDAEFVRHEQELRTVYTLGIPWEELNASPDDGMISSSMAIIDYDGDSETGLLEWGEGIFGGKDNSLFNKVTLLEE